MSVLLEAGDFHVSYGAIKALAGFSLSLHDREIVAVIGANGAKFFLMAKNCLPKVFRSLAAVCRWYRRAEKYSRP